MPVEAPARAPERAAPPRAPEKAVSPGKATSEALKSKADATSSHAAIESLAKGGIAIDITAKTGPEGATASVKAGAVLEVSGPKASDAKGVDAKGAEGTKPAELSEAEQAEKNQETYVNQAMYDWDKKNPPPEGKDEAATSAWWEKRGEALKTTKVDAKVETDMKTWDKANPEPNRETDPDKHKEWLNKKTEAREQAKEKRNREKDVKPEESKESIIRKAQKLAELNQEIVHLRASITSLKALPESKQRNADIDLNQVKLDQKTSESRTLYQEINSAVISKNPVAQFAIMAAVIAALAGASLVATSAKDL